MQSVVLTDDVFHFFYENVDGITTLSQTRLSSSYLVLTGTKENDYPATYFRV